MTACRDRSTCAPGPWPHPLSRRLAPSSRPKLALFFRPVSWTWKDCWQDAVALLGSEQAVRDYIEGNKEEAEEETNQDGQKDLFGNPIPVKPKQGKMF